MDPSLETPTLTHSPGPYMLLKVPWNSFLLTYTKENSEIEVAVTSQLKTEYGTNQISLGTLWRDEGHTELH